MSEELKPCPFCGGEAEIVQVHKNVYVRCRKCGALAGDVSFKEKVAIAAWNKRSYKDVLFSQEEIDFIKKDFVDWKRNSFSYNELDLIRKAMVRFYNVEKNSQSARLAEDIALKCEDLLERAQNEKIKVV